MDWITGLNYKVCSNIYLFQPLKVISCMIITLYTTHSGSCLKLYSSVSGLFNCMINYYDKFIIMYTNM